MGEFEEKFDALRADISRMTSIPSSASIVRRAKRRRGLQAACGSLAVVAVIGGGAFAVGSVRASASHQEEGSLPVPSSPTITITATPAISRISHGVTTTGSSPTASTKSLLPVGPASVATTPVSPPQTLQPSAPGSQTLAPSARAVVSSSPVPANLSPLATALAALPGTEQFPSAGGLAGAWSIISTVDNVQTAGSYASYCQRRKGAFTSAPLVAVQRGYTQSDLSGLGALVRIEVAPSVDAATQAINAIGGLMNDCQGFAGKETFTSVDTIAAGDGGTVFENTGSGGLAELNAVLRVGRAVIVLDVQGQGGLTTEVNNVSAMAVAVAAKLKASGI